MITNSRNAQASIEYITLIGIALIIFAAFLLVEMFMYSSFKGSANYNQIYEMGKAIVNGVNEIASQSVGSIYSFSFLSPGLTSPSFFCGNIIVLDSMSKQEAAVTANINVSGVLPTNSGQFQAYISLAKTASGEKAIIGLDLPISKVIQVYKMNTGYISYNLTFLNVSNSPVQTAFDLSALYPNDTSINSIHTSTNSGNAVGNLTIPPSISSAIMLVTISQYSEEAGQCVS